MRMLFAVIMRSTMLGVFITWGTIFTLSGQSSNQQNIIEAGAVPKVFLQEGVSVPNDESAPSFTPDGKTVYLSDHNTICFSKMVNGKWTKPKPVSISGHWHDWDASLSPDGKQLVFVSNRPLEGMPQDSAQKKGHLWYSSHLSGENWSAPRHIGAPVNLDGFSAYAPSISNAGALCFCSRGRNGNKGMCGYYAKWLGDHYDKPKLLSLNGDKDIFDPYISPDERYIIFVSEKSIFISYRHGSDWLPGQKLSTQVNNGGSNGGPYVSPDGKMLYYSSSLVEGILMVPVSIPKTVH